MRFIVFLIFAAVFFGASAEFVEAPIESLSYHFRIKLNDHNGAKFGLKWNETDSANYKYATVETYGTATEDAWAESINLIIGEVNNGQDSVYSKNVITGDFDLYRLGISLRMDVGENGGILSIGSRQAIDTFEIAYNLNQSSNIYGWIEGKAEILRNDLQISALTPATYAEFKDIETLKSYIDKSSDPNEGIWSYFDRNTDPLRTKLGGDYVLATIKADNGYDIVYLDGANEEKASWKPMRIKGHLIPATFAGVFDLVWFTPEGKRIDFETSATIADDLLTISLPYWKSKVRYRRTNLPLL